jgi:hypothetical protein
LIWLLSILLLTLPGTLVWRIPRVARMNIAARIGLAFAAGIFIATLLMYVYALLGFHWTRANLFIPLTVLSFFGVRRLSSAFERPNVLQAAFLALTLYAIADARATCGDIVFIWAPKAQAFATSRTIDLKFLAFPHYYLMHPDYPPLVPLTYAFGSIAAHDFSWWGALFVAFFVLMAIAAIVRGFGASRPAMTLFTAIMSFAFVSAYLPGGADPFLILFECVAIAALTFEPESREARAIAAFALAAAAFTKVEGASFAIIVAIAYVMTQRKVVRALGLLLPSCVLLGSWLIFMAKHLLLDQYARAGTPIVWHLLRDDLKLVWRFASFRAFWLPWIAPLALIRPSRKIAFPLLVAAGSIASTMFFYLHNPDPAYWIASSADRVLVTPLMCVAIAYVVQADRRSDAPVGQPV